MKKKKKEKILVSENIVPIDYSEEMKTSYIDYALSVIAARALPDVRDGLKPVHRRTLYSMNELNLTSDKPYKKCARVVGDVLGKYHPHGDTAVYDALVRMAQPFSLKNTLVDGHGNFGSIDGDSAAAMRYTEARLAMITNEMLRDLDKGVVDFVPNFDGSLKEPSVLPCRYPNLLVNGTSGIAVGMATTMPPHNLKECINATLAYMDNQDISYKKLLSILKGPDFPTGGTVINKDDLESIYSKGKGSIKLRGKAEIEDITGGKFNIVITEVPYSISGSVTKFVESLADLVKDKKIDNIADIRDESNRQGLRIVIETKKGVNPEILLNKLYKFSKLQDSIRVEFLALVNAKNSLGENKLIPRQLSLKEILHHFIVFQEEIMTKKSRFDLNKAINRLEIVDGLLTAIQYIDIIIEAIRGSESDKDAKICLMTGDITDIEFRTKAAAKKASSFHFTERQAEAILDMRLRRLSSLQSITFQNEKVKLENIIKECNEILTNPEKLKEVIKTDLKEISSAYSEKRKTQIGNLAIDETILIEEKSIEKNYILLDKDHYIKALDKNTFAKLSHDELKDYTNIVECYSNDKLCVFTSYARLHQIKIESIPKTKFKDKGVPIDTLCKIDLSLHSEDDEQILFIDTYTNLDNHSILMLTSGGFGKLINPSEYASFRANVKATNILDGDKLIFVQSVKRDFIDKTCVTLFTNDAFVLKFALSSIPEGKKESQGVKCMILNKTASIVSCGVFDDKKSTFSIVATDNFTTEIQLSPLKIQNRNTKGKKVIPGRKFTNSEVTFITTIEEPSVASDNTALLDND